MDSAVGLNVSVFQLKLTWKPAFLIRYVIGSLKSTALYDAFHVCHQSDYIMTLLWCWLRNCASGVELSIMARAWKSLDASVANARDV